MNYHMTIYPQKKKITNHLWAITWQLKTNK